jgi:hypothetical protein
MKQNIKYYLGVTVAFFISSQVVSAGEEKKMMGDIWPDLSGKWTVEIVAVADSKIPVLGRVQSKTESILEAEIQQNGADLLFIAQTRSVEIRSGISMVRTLISDAFLKSMPEVRRKGHLRRREDGGVELFFPLHWQIQGARLKDIASDPLPESSADPRVFDQDGDGQPGVTVRVEGIVSGNLYVVQRSWDEWQATLGATGEVHGQMKWGMEQVILGSSRSFLRRQPETVPVASESVFVMRKKSD